jgi:Immunity protein 8
MKNEVRAEIKEVLIWVGPFRDDTLENFRPEDPQVFGFNAQIFIGEVGDERYDSFDICVCSPSWFAQQVDEGVWDRFRKGILRVIPEAIAVGSYFWFMKSWSREEFDNGLRAVCDVYSPARDWGTVASRIGRVIPWEYASRYDKFVNESFGETYPPAKWFERD